jgi:hypothetical protein
MAERSPILRIVEEDNNVMHTIFKTTPGDVTVMMNVAREPGRLVLSQIHVEGNGLTRAIIKRAARELGLMEGVDEVVLRGGVRTSGASPGTTPKPIFVKVGQ